MQKKLVFIIILIGAVAVLLGIMKFFGGNSPKQGVLKVQSTPQASIFLNNKHIGRTPLEQKVDSGEYEIRLVPETTTQSLAPWQGTIRISPQLLTFVNGSLAESEFMTAVETLWLEKISGKNAELTVTTNPDGASMSIDNEVKGVTPISIPNIVSGDHTMTLASTGFVSRTVKIRSTAGYKVNAIIKLALSPFGDHPSEASASSSSAAQTSGDTTKATPKITPTTGASSSASISLTTSPNPQKPFVTIKDTPTGFLRVRMEPSTSATEAGRVKPGEKFHVEDEKGGWYEIKYDGKNNGWISGQYAEKTE